MDVSAGAEDEPMAGEDEDGAPTAENKQQEMIRPSMAPWLLAAESVSSDYGDADMGEQEDQSAAEQSNDDEATPSKAPSMRQASAGGVKSLLLRGLPFAHNAFACSIGTRPSSSSVCLPSVWSA